MTFGDPPWPYPRHVSTHQANFAYGEIAGTDTLGCSSLKPGEDTPVLAYPSPLLPPSTYKLTTDEQTGDDPGNDVEILREFFESELIYDCTQTWSGASLSSPERPGATSSSTRRTEQAYFRFRLTADNHFMVVLRKLCC